MSNNLEYQLFNVLLFLNFNSFHFYEPNKILSIIKQLTLVGTSLVVLGDLWDVSEINQSAI